MKRVGVTTALHVVEDTRSAKVGHLHGTVLRQDAISDSCFIHLPEPPSDVGFTQVKIMRGIAPRPNSGAWFKGSISSSDGNPTHTMILATDVFVPHLVENMQLRIYTSRDAQLGDSGAALVTEDGVAGFAFHRTKHGELPAMCSWIWAHSVVKALEIEEMDLSIGTIKARKGSV